MFVVQDHHQEQTICLSKAISHLPVSNCLPCHLELGFIVPLRTQNSSLPRGFGQQYGGLIPMVLYQQGVQCCWLFFIHGQNSSFQPAQALGESASDDQSQHCLASSMVCLRCQ